MKNTNNSNKLAFHMLIAMVAGIAVGLLFMGIRESIGADSTAWLTINNLLFQDITAEGAEKQSVFSIFADSFLSGRYSSSLFQWYFLPW